MGGRFGKYGDLKRRRALQRGRKEKFRLAKAAAIDRRNRAHTTPAAHMAGHPAAPKTYKTAIVVIPPDHLWGPIQKLRRQHDRHFRRWMPHITLIYPFRPLAAFDQIIPLLEDACRDLDSIQVRLGRFAYFTHSRQRATCYLAPEPAEAFIALHRRLLGAVPDCDDTARFAGGFAPHLSLGQARIGNAAALCRRWRAGWHPLSFTLDRFHLIWRNDPPDDIFRIGPVLALGAKAIG